jgi:hypothetical protein
MRTLVRYAALAALLAPPAAGAAPQGGSVARLTIYDAGVAEVLEERAIDLQAGLNVLEWRSLLPNAHLSTVRVTVEGAEVVRQDVTMDGAQVGDTKSPVLHLQVRNSGAAGARRVQVDYLVPRLDWRNDYSLVFDQDPGGAPPTAGELDSWVSVSNEVGADLVAGSVDLVSGELALLVGERRGYVAAAQNVSNNSFSVDEDSSEVAGGESLSAFTRFTLGRNLALQSNAEVSRFPLFQRARVALVQRNVFESAHDDQTLARGGFILMPRGLEVRLVSSNSTGTPMPAGTVTVYARIGGVAQVVGQDRINHTAPGEQFAASLGRSSTLLGTRRIVETRRVEYRETDGDTAYKKVTSVEVELTNRSKAGADAFVRDGIEGFGQGNWSILSSSAPHERLGASTVQFALKVPAGGKAKLTYTVEIK